ncbi:hypothetical protein P152DRAFT_484286 [Eremomyces bilateralis CBS 781.70]|uniref:MICOS complex subunit MIC12 n=1 Tax=Eremomyces bilateralis CBS 781.70 TaxID=1392243 RepID=A0A6G1FW45_9PEZI|nr:uncharacterized protein P152DRAFT_484286 [Eremomyces bilateralis CBS 781.70]KAF1809948.1 hypothetical protein P152DRAFT_484286 [Eremomyces bilateralis CBS 781.70]
MGFTTGFLSGITITTSLLYLTVLSQNSTRATQRTLLSQQRALLTQTYDPVPSLPEPRAHTENAGLSEMAKDRWNADVERLARWASNINWDEVRERVEVGAGNVWRKVREAGEPMRERVENAEVEEEKPKEVAVTVTPVEKSRWGWGKSS